MENRSAVRWIYRHPRLYDLVDTLLSLGLSEKVRRKVLAGMDVSSILEIGIGTGKCVKYLRADLVVGLDRSYEMLRHLKKGNPNINLACGDAANLPFPDKRFDLSLFCYCLASLPDPSRALVEGLRVSKKVLVIDYDRPWIIPRCVWTRIVKVLGRLIFGSTWLDYQRLSCLARCESSRLYMGLYRIMILDGLGNG